MERIEFLDRMAQGKVSRRQMGITNPKQMMEQSIVFRSTPDAVQVAQNRAWGDVKALKL